MIRVSHYGIHWAGDIAFLMQKTGTNARGAAIRPPFEVVTPKRKGCNHLIPFTAPITDPAHWDFFLKLLDDPLVEAMLPIPKPDPRACYVVDDTDELGLYLVMLSKLSSPIVPIVHPVWTLDAVKIADELQVTNVQPLVVTGFAAKDTELVKKASQVAVLAPRQLVMVGFNDVVIPSNVRHITTHISKYPLADIAMLPLEGIGANVVRRFMRKEDMRAPAVDRKEKRGPFRPKPRENV